MNREKIAYIPSDEFDSACEQDFAEIDGELYAAEDVPVSPSDTAGTESFLVAVAQSRILTVQGEQFLFKRLNFLRFRANALQATLKGNRKASKTQKEIERLLKEANDTREQIACANIRLVTSIVRKLVGPNDFDEFLAESNTILLNAIDKFDYSRGYRFSTYATHAVQRHIYRLIERQAKRKQRESADSDIVYAAEARGIAVDKPSDNEVMNAMNQILASFDTTLNEREQLIVRERFGLNESGRSRSLRAIGDDIGLSKERVRQLLHQSIEKLAAFAKPFESLFERIGVSE